MAASGKGGSAKAGWRDDQDWERLRRHVDRGDSILIEWSLNDVRQVAQEKTVNLTRKECRLVLALSESNHDAATGLTFDDVASHVEAVVKRRKKPSKPKSA